MEILTVDFENHALLEINGELVKITPFKERESYIVKIGVDAPKNMVVNREEIHKALLGKK